MKSIQIMINGMSCQGCADRLVRLFNREPGIGNASVSFDSSIAEIDFDPDQLSPNRLKQIVADAGFSAG